MPRLQGLIRIAMALFVTACLSAVAMNRAQGAEPADPLTAEVERWAAFLRGNPAKDELWTQIKEGSEPALARTEAALRDGRRWLALQRLARLQSELAAAAYLQERRGGVGTDVAAFEQEWRRMGAELGDGLGPLSPGAMGGVRPAAVRAVGEAALPQVRIFYDASLEYGRNTMPEYGLFYLGSAQAEREFTAFCRRLSSVEGRPAPRLRSLGAELDGLEDELLAAYRPPASIDRHREFIAASGVLKEARELDAAGLRYGAMLRYLQATLRMAPLRPEGAAWSRDEAARRLHELGPRLRGGDVDHSLGAIFLEAAEADLAATAADAKPADAIAVAQDVLPRYFTALEPERPQPPAPTPRVTVTLVRWPYT